MEVLKLLWINNKWVKHTDLLRHPFWIPSSNLAFSDYHSMFHAKVLKENNFLLSEIYKDSKSFKICMLFWEPF